MFISRAPTAERITVSKKRDIGPAFRAAFAGLAIAALLTNPCIVAYIGALVLGDVDQQLKHIYGVPRTMTNLCNQISASSVCHNTV